MNARLQYLAYVASITLLIIYLLLVDTHPILVIIVGLVSMGIVTTMGYYLKRAELIQEVYSNDYRS